MASMSLGTYKQHVDQGTEGLACPTSNKKNRKPDWGRGSSFARHWAE